jgi:hypothetical protein
VFYKRSHGERARLSVFSAAAWSNDELVKYRGGSLVGHGSMDVQELEERIRRFLASGSAHFDFPMGGTTPIPMQSEQDLVSLFIDAPRLTPSVAAEFRSTLTRPDAYSLAIFAIRMAVLAVRTNSERTLVSSFWAIVIDNDVLDWRDVLACLAIIEDCCLRIGCNFHQLTHLHLDLATQRRRKTICDGYLIRSGVMRTVEVFGFKAVRGADGELGYVKRG